jgi:biotin-dependent carboxylase-like uncharacterized protein
MIEVISTGLFSSIQDEGRVGYRNQGVPISGAMDLISARFANSLLDNSLDNAVLEMTIIGAKLLFKSNTIIAITGADMSPKINNQKVLNYKTYEILEGDILSFGKLLVGARSYLGVKGGIQSEFKLNSRSQFTNITQDNRIHKNERIEINTLTASFEVERRGKIKNKLQFFETNKIEVFPGPEFGLFSKEEQIKLLNTNFTVSNNSNRMGYQMEEHVVCHSNSMLTSPVLPGTVQLFPSGKIVILMKDAQTTGGYPRIFQLTNFAVSVMAQKKVGDRFKLKLVSTYI